MDNRGLTSITMTEATTAIWGTSGTGNPNAVRIIEATAAYGYLLITHRDKRARDVSVVQGTIPAEALSKEDRAYYKKMYEDDIKAEIEYEAERMKRAIAAAPTSPAKAQAFLNGVGAMLRSGGR
jgi:hypothetical protein